MDPIPIGTKLKDLYPEENTPAPVIVMVPLVGASKPTQVISKLAFDIRKPRLLEITDKAIEEKRVLTYDEVKDYIALPVKVDVEPVEEEIKVG